MLVHVVDYLASLGGGVRFVAEMLRALQQAGDTRYQVVSHGPALERYRELLAGTPRIDFADVPPANLWRLSTVMVGIPGAGPLNWLLGTPEVHFEVPAAVFEGCDRVWLPWLHQHRIPWRLAGKAVASLHDVIMLEFPRFFPAKWRHDEERTVRRWLSSSARIAVSSHATVATVGRLFGVGPDRLRVIPLSGDHSRPPEGSGRRDWPFLGRPFLHCPTNASPHKNLDVVLSGVAAWGAKHPLVLTGTRTDLWASGRDDRREHLRHLAEAAGLVRDRDLFALGYVDDAAYFHILERAWALLMPTLAEGGGSFPVWEALHAGVPVLCSDMPVMREMVERVGGEVLWFDPLRPDDLVARLTELERDYPRYRAIATARSRALRSRTWLDVAREYASFLGLPEAT